MCPELFSSYLDACHYSLTLRNTTFAHRVSHSITSIHSLLSCSPSGNQQISGKLEICQRVEGKSIIGTFGGLWL
jgi:hypothetical protein